MAALGHRTTPIPVPVWTPKTPKPNTPPGHTNPQEAGHKHPCRRLDRALAVPPRHRRIQISAQPLARDALTEQNAQPGALDLLLLLTRLTEASQAGTL